jgi:ABC-type iron transport system FetAB ATPase subunit
MELFSGDRIGIKGPSGVGKSQVLRTICGLENFDRSSVFLRDECAMEIPMPEWRRRVSLVVQDRPSLEGTPRECFYELSDYKSARNVALGDPCYLVTSWGFESSILDQSWSALSGGEAQVAALALTLSLKPEVLLLDESTNALDDASAIKVEKTIASMKIPAILVSHAEVQLDRFCTSIVNFNDRPRETAGPSGSTFRQCVSS